MEFYAIRKKRLSTGLNIRETAKAAGVQASVLGAIEARRKPPDYETLQKLSTYYGCPVADLI